MCVVKGRRQLVGKRWVLLIALAVGLSVIGISYAAWTGNLRILGNITIGNFAMSFQEGSGQYTAKIVDTMSLTARNLETVDCEARIDGNGRTAELIFNRGLPLDLLMEGRYLQITYPIAPADGSVTPSSLRAGTAAAPGRTVDFTPDESLIVVDHVGYMFDQWTEDYAIPLNFEFYQTINSQNTGLNRMMNQGDAEGVIWLSLSAESIAAVSALPEMIEIPASILEEAECIPVQDNGDGVRVTYRCTIPVMIEPAGTR